MKIAVGTIRRSCESIRKMSFTELIYTVETYRSREVSEMRIKNKKLGTTKAMTPMLATRHHAA